MDELRWTLLIAGIAIVAGIYGFTRWQESRRKTRRSRGGLFVDDVDLEQALRDLDHVVADDDPLETGELDREEDDFEVIRITRNDPPKPAPAAAPARAEPAASVIDEVPRGLDEKVVVLNVAATDGRLFGGDVLVDVLESVGMRYGEHAIYHRILETRKGQVALFSAANILRPGTFEPERLSEIESPGVALFLQLPGPYDGLVAFEQMLETARRIASQLDLKLLDERRCTLTNQAIEHIREELREYRRLTHLLAKKS